MGGELKEKRFGQGGLLCCSSTLLVGALSRSSVRMALRTARLDSSVVRGVLLAVLWSGLVGLLRLWQAVLGR